MQTKLLATDDGVRTWALVFTTDEEAIGPLTRFAEEQKLSASEMSAIGAFREATLGYFNLERKDYDRIPVREQVEVLSLIGHITREPNEEPNIHAHVVLGKADGAALGGHLMEATVRPTLEVILTESPRHLRRRTDPATGLALIDVGAST
jgi:predicted DNA-binding protein with PD1-like motif